MNLTKQNVIICLIVWVGTIILAVFIFHNTHIHYHTIQTVIKPDTHVSDSLAIQIKYKDSIINNHTNTYNENKIKYITIRDSIINISDSAKNEFLTNYISHYKSIKY